MRGTLKIKIEGLNANKIINKLVDENVFIKNIKEKKKYLTFEIDERDEEKLKQICKLNRKKYQIISKNNFVNGISHLKYYVGFVVAIILVASLIFSFNLYIYEVNLNASSEFDMTEVKQLLEENEIALGMKKNNIDIKEIEKLILTTQNNIAGCSVKLNGGVLDIMIYPGVLKNELSTENVYSNYNAVITDVEIYAGTSNIKIGDVIQKGDLLIKNNNGASGKIMAKVYYSDYIIYNENQLERVKTGNIFSQNSLMVFGKKFYKSKKNCTFPKYLEENCVFCISKNLFFPIYYVKTIYEEIVYNDVIVPFESQEEKLKQKLFSSVVSSVNEEDITNVSFSVVKENNLTRLDVFVECEIDITK